MNPRPEGPLVSPHWLADRLNDAQVSIVDATWHLPTVDRNAAAEFEEVRLPGAVFFDIDRIAAPRTDLSQTDLSQTDLPHMLASPERFAQMVGTLGISDDDTIIVYDTYGLFSSARVWWNFKIMGVQNVFILDGGLPAWREIGLPIESGPVATKPARNFSAEPLPSGAVNAEFVLQSLENEVMQIVDVRPAPRFLGDAPEPRAGLRSGHMPGAVNLPFGELIENGRLKPKEELEQLFSTLGIDLKLPIVSTCGSGVTAPLINLALAQMGHDALMVYDGSWAEWGGDERLPVVKG